jgi:hypothetical protein
MYLIYSPRWHSLQIGFGNLSETGLNSGVMASPSRTVDFTENRTGDFATWVRITPCLAGQAAIPTALRLQIGNERARTIFAIYDCLSRWNRRRTDWMKARPFIARCISSLLLAAILATPLFTTSHTRSNLTARPPESLKPTQEEASEKLLQQLRKSALQTRAWRERNFGFSGIAIPVLGQKNRLLMPLGGSGVGANDTVQFLLFAQTRAIHLLFENSVLTTVAPSARCEQLRIFKLPANATIAIAEAEEALNGSAQSGKANYWIEPWDGKSSLDCTSVPQKSG